MKKVLSIVFILCITLSFCACGNTSTTDDEKDIINVEDNMNVEDNNQEENVEEENKTTFEVRAIDQNGNGVAGVLLQLYATSSVTARTDASGVATFAVEEASGYKLSVLSKPAGYEYFGDAETHLTKEQSGYTLTFESTAK